MAVNAGRSVYPRSHRPRHLDAADYVGAGAGVPSSVTEPDGSKKPLEIRADG